MDNDSNFLVNDIYGADYVDNDGDPITTDSHGTHCAGLIAGVGNNGLGITGVAWSGAQIMALRFIDGQNGSLTDAIQCIDYAIAKGAKVINASYGSTSRSDTGSLSEAAAIYRAQQAGITIVAAAGNDGTNNDTTPFFPASYTDYIERSFFPRRAYALNNIIAVGATDRNDNRAGFSNFGANSVDLMAPGVEMWSTSISGTSNSHYVSDEGSSFAAPVVAGAMALLVAEYPNDTVSQRVARVVNTNAVDVVPALSGLCVTGGRLNLAKLLPAADVNTLPSALAWHRPNYREPLINSSMRTPTPVLLSNDVTIFSGLKKFNNTNDVNTYGVANQAGGWLFYRTSGVVAWSSNALSFHANSGDYQFWKATVPGVSARTFEYYLQLDFESGARTTFSHYANNIEGFTATTNQTAAASSPYTFSVPKATPSISTPPSASPIRLGQTLADSSLNGGFASVLGSFSFTQPTLAPALGTSSNSVAFTPTDPSNYETAFTSASVTVGGILNPSQDSDGDGIPNLLEHALAGFSIPPSTSTPLGQITTQSLDGTNGPETILSLDVTVRIDDPAVTIEPEASLDLASDTNWITNGFTIHIPDQTDVPPGFELRQYRFNAGTNSRAFMRLNVQQQ